VLTAVLGGGRSADDQVRLVPWGDERVPDRPAGEAATPLPAVAPVVVARADIAVESPPMPDITPQELLPVMREIPSAVSADKKDKDGGSRRGKKVKRPVPLPPWPGRLPQPAPALVLPQALPAVVLDAERQLVGVSARLELSGDPTYLLIGTAAAPVEITGWAGPWPVDERWWAPAESRRRARFQVSLEDGRALLLSLSSGHWAIEAVYD
jgi:protein ImuB